MCFAVCKQGLPSKTSEVNTSKEYQIKHCVCQATWENNLTSWGQPVPSSGQSGIL